jgi:hypothetical protein
MLNHEGICGWAAAGNGHTSSMIRKGHPRHTLARQRRRQQDVVAAKPEGTAMAIGSLIVRFNYRQMGAEVPDRPSRYRAAMRRDGQSTNRGRRLTGPEREA